MCKACGIVKDKGAIYIWTSGHSDSRISAAAAGLLGKPAKVYWDHKVFCEAIPPLPRDPFHSVHLYHLPTSICRWFIFDQGKVAGGLLVQQGLWENQ